mmetsp:Transcript_74103/g.131037  ORF Transcript_74103/g.131037 Transcript_74103/m.131037 type:complete len:208 (+) Transcript_74103:240-863(+)
MAVFALLRVLLCAGEGPKDIHRSSIIELSRSNFGHMRRTPQAMELDSTVCTRSCRAFSMLDYHAVKAQNQVETQHAAQNLPSPHYLMQLRPAAPARSPLDSAQCMQAVRNSSAAFYTSASRLYQLASAPWPILRSLWSLTSALHQQETINFPPTTPAVALPTALRLPRTRMQEGQAQSLRRVPTATKVRSRRPVAFVRAGGFESRPS